MKISAFMMFNAVISIGLGIAFSLYAPLMMAFFAVQEYLEGPLAYWQVAAFARLYGISQLGIGLILLSIRTLVDELAPNSRRGILSALVLANLLAMVVALTQQQAAWQTLAGWVAFGIYSIFFIGYVLAYIQNQKGTV